MTNSYLCPLFWQHHEGEDALRDEIRAMSENGIGSFIVEARPHPYYLQDAWWSDLAILIDEAKKRNMGVWIFDDGSYPSGAANGLIRKHYPQYTKKYLAHHHIDAIGPKRGASVLVSPWLQEGEELIGVIAGKRLDSLDLMDSETFTDITGYIHDGILYWDIPDGEWRIFIFKQTPHGGEEGTKDYLNPLEPEGTAAFIELIYEEHYKHFSEEFGKTILGFFTDEPRFGNAPGYGYRLGNRHMVIPWSETVLDELSSKGLGDFKLLLPALFYECGERTPDARYSYMDVVSKRFDRCFIGQIGDWCRAHDVRLIGHVVEENGAHARLGYGAGHYFRSLDGMDASGIDVVNNIYPGRTNGKYLTMFNDYDTTFNHWGLSKMASSAAHLDPKKNGTAMCEAFGAYGWSEGLRAMKWITDAMCVRGVNLIVPHAFSPMEFPDPDCPPHFYAGGNNPQFPLFHVWSDYANRVCDRISGGVHVAPVAVLYHAEAEWGGFYEPFENVVKSLMQSQIDCDVLPVDVLANRDRCKIENGIFTVNQENYRALVVPYSRYLAPAMETVLQALVKNGIPVIFTQAYPQRYYYGNRFEMADGMYLTQTSELASFLRSKGIQDISASAPCSHLAYYHYKKQGTDYYFFTNEDVYQDVCTEIDFTDAREAIRYDAMTDSRYRIEQIRTADGNCRVKLVLKPYESTFIVFGETASEEAYNWEDENLACMELPADGWTIHAREYKPGSDFTLLSLKELGNISAPDRMPKFSGTIRYERKFMQTAGRKLLLSLGEVYECARILVNDIPVGEKICPPYSFEIPETVLKNGENKLTVEVTNTLSKAHHDNWFDRFWVQDPSGLLGPVRITTAANG